MIVKIPISYGNVPIYENKEQIESDLWNEKLFDKTLRYIAKLIYYRVPIDFASYNL